MRVKKDLAEYYTSPKVAPLNVDMQKKDTVVNPTTVDPSLFFKTEPQESPVLDEKEKVEVPNTVTAPAEPSLRDEILTAIRGFQNPTPTYEGNAHDQRADAILEAVRNYSFEDYTKGDAYKALVERYGDGGRRAMQDTIGQLSARTGGLASSYAGTAAQQTYNDYMAELEAVARGEYDKDRQSKIDDAKLSLSLGDREYERWQDGHNRDRADRSAALDALYQLLGFDRDAENTAASRKAEAQKRIYDILAKDGGDIGQIPAALIEESGLTTPELAAMMTQYKGTGSGDTGVENTGDLALDGLFAEDEEDKKNEKVDTERIVNQCTSSWIMVNGIRLSYQELYDGIKNGSIIEEYDSKTGKYTYSKK